MMYEIQTDYSEVIEVMGRATVEGGAHLFVFNEGDVETVSQASLSIPQVKQLRKALKKAAGL